MSPPPVEWLPDDQRWRARLGHVHAVIYRMGTRYTWEVWRDDDSEEPCATWAPEIPVDLGGAKKGAEIALRRAFMIPKR